MHVISKRRLAVFWRVRQDAEAPLRAWLTMMRGARYSNPHELKQVFPTVDFLGSGLAVFNIRGNRYRLVVTIRYEMGRVYVRNILTHGQYAKLSSENRFRGPPDR